MTSNKTVGYHPIQEQHSQFVETVLDELKISRTVNNKHKLLDMALNMGLTFIPVCAGFGYGLKDEFPELQVSDGETEPTKPTVPYRCPNCGVPVTPRPDKVLVCNCKVWIE